jgi:outer membrane protein assembly factor BamB
MMTSAGGGSGRRTLLLGLSGLVPAALVVLLLVNQPSYGEWRLYPSLRVPLAGAALLLALATLVSWIVAGDRLRAQPLMGLAWAGVTALVAIGPFLEATPRPRLYALDLRSGAVQWSTIRSGEAPIVIAGQLYVTDPDDRALVALDPVTGKEMWRDRLRPDHPHSRALSREATLVAATANGGIVLLDARKGSRASGTAFRACVPAPRAPVLVTDGSRTYATADQGCSDRGSAAGYRDGVAFVADRAGGIVRALDAATGVERWRAGVPAARAPVILPERVGVASGTAGRFLLLDSATGERIRDVDLGGEEVVTAAAAGQTVYVYTASPVAGGGRSGTIVALDAPSGRMRWRRALQADVAAGGGAPALGAYDDGLIVGGGLRVVDLDARSGDVRWTVDVTTLGQSRRYALPGSLQRVTVADGRVFLSTSASA